MKIGRGSRTQLGRSGKRPPASSSGSGVSFDAVLWERERVEFDHLLEEIEQLAERLDQSLHLIDLHRYRQAVGRFLQLASEKAYRIQEEPGISRGGHRKLFQLVREVDAFLASLAQETLEGQKEHLKVLAQLHEIRGLLFDLEG